MSRNGFFLRTAVLAAASFVSAAALCAKQPAMPETTDLTGKYELAGGGYLVVSVDDAGRAEGFFKRNGLFGRLTGRADGGAISGAWVQEKGLRACKTTVDGSSYWGGVTLTRGADGAVAIAWKDCGGEKASD